MTQLVLGTASPAFSEALTDHIITARWTETGGWHGRELRGYVPLMVDPAMVGLRDGQAIFEGLKALRFQCSARRLAMPELPVAQFVAAANDLPAPTRTRRPTTRHRACTYGRCSSPANRPLVLRPACEYLLLFVAFVTGGYFADKPAPVLVWVSRTYRRAMPGGASAVNYAAYLAQQKAEEHGCKQVVWLNPVRGDRVEELGGTNLFFVGRGPGGPRVVIPRLTATLLPGVTRDALLRRRLDHRGLRLRHRRLGHPGSGPVTLAFRERLTAVQQGHAADPYGWRHPVR